MSTFTLFAVTAIFLLCIGLYALIVYEHLLRKILALNVMSAGVFLFLVAVAYRNKAPAPDPVPHAMVLTGIVVAVSVTAFALALARRIHREEGLPVIPDLDDLA
jgi:multicomponent Na+:H+ antiporter subunit C